MIHTDTIRHSWRRLRIPAILALAAVAGGVVLAAQVHDPEWFDTTGMPRRPSTFVEQQILDMIQRHRPGDLADAARIQQKLGRYYADKGDEPRANQAFQRAVPPGPPGPPGSPTAGPAKPVDRSSPPQPSRVSASKLAGNYYGYEGRTLHIWDFQASGTFLHTWIVSGAGTSVRSSERGEFQLDGDFLALKIDSAATAFATPGVGGRSTQLGGGADGAQSHRRLSIRWLKEGVIVLDGNELKVKSW